MALEQEDIDAIVTAILTTDTRPFAITGSVVGETELDEGDTLELAFEADEATTLASMITPAILARLAAIEAKTESLGDLDVDGYDMTEAMRLLLAVNAGELSGGGTTTNIIRAADDSKPRITATVDKLGNRTVLTLDATP